MATDIIELDRNNSAGTTSFTVLEDCYIMQLFYCLHCGGDTWDGCTLNIKHTYNGSTYTVYSKSQSGTSNSTGSGYASDAVGLKLNAGDVIELYINTDPDGAYGYVQIHTDTELF